MSIREPAVAGMFYPAGAAALRNQVESCFSALGGPGSLPTVNHNGPRSVIGLVCPHAGYMYSGSVAACAYYRLAEDGLPDIAVILGPNHRSYLPSAALTNDKAWRTPLGDIAVDVGIAEAIVARYPEATIDPSAHIAEHSLEVQLPFLQYLSEPANTQMKIVPVLIGASAHANSLDFSRGLGEAIAEVLHGKDAVVIASTDFTHYESSEAASGKDSRAISAILALDEESLLETVETLDISMCGVLPTAVMIVACKKLGAISAERLAYQNSGDVTGDYSEVVGYAALDIHR